MAQKKKGMRKEEKNSKLRHHFLKVYNFFQLPVVMEPVRENAGALSDAS